MKRMAFVMTVMSCIAIVFPAAAGAGRTDESPTPDECMQAYLKGFGQVTEALESIRSKKDAETAKPNLERLVEKMEDAVKQLDSHKLSAEEKKKLEEKYKKESEKAAARFVKAIVAIQQADVEAFKTLDPLLARLGKKK